MVWGRGDLPNYKKQWSETLTASGHSLEVETWLDAGRGKTQLRIPFDWDTSYHIR